MASRAAFRLLLVLVALPSIESKNFDSKTFLRNTFVSQPFEDRVYVIPRQSQTFERAVAEDTCREIGGYLAKLGAGRRQFEYIRKSIVESGQKESAFFIGEANRDAPKLLRYPSPDDANCTIFVKLDSINVVNVWVFAPCYYTGNLICEVPLESSTSTSTDSKGLLQHFYISRSHRGRVYLVKKRFGPFALSDANKDCKAYGGYLLEVETADEIEFLEKFLSSENYILKIFFTGGFDTIKEGEYRWYNSRKIISMSDGTTFPWGQNQPDNWSDFEDCIIFTKNSEFRFADYPCNSEGFYICEVPICDTK